MCLHYGQTLVTSQKRLTAGRMNHDYPLGIEIGSPEQETA